MSGMTDPLVLWVQALTSGRYIVRMQGELVVFLSQGSSQHTTMSNVPPFHRVYSPIGVLCDLCLYYSRSGSTGTIKMLFDGRSFVWRDKTGRKHSVTGRSFPKPVEDWWQSYSRRRPLRRVLPLLRDKEMTVDLFASLLATEAPWVR